MWRSFWIIILSPFLLAATLEARPRPAPDADKAKQSSVKVQQPIVKPHRYVILVDAGHGGLEEGTHSTTSIPPYCEKDLTLKTARYLQRYLQQLGHQVFMTRDRDCLVTLEQRTALANKKGVDLFVSVHYNSAPSLQASGVEVFYFRDPCVSTRCHESENLARYVLNGVIEQTKATSRGVKHASFAVIRETKMPAILVEGGFLTNAVERQRLVDPAYLQTIARGIALGVEHYLADKKVAALP